MSNQDQPPARGSARPPGLSSQAFEAISGDAIVRDQRQREATAATVRTADDIGRLVQAANDAERRENKMLRWTIAGVVLAGIAAVASIVALIIAG
jgi:hypothetical protein